VLDSHSRFYFLCKHVCTQFHTCQQHWHQQTLITEINYEWKISYGSREYGLWVHKMNSLSWSSIIHYLDLSRLEQGTKQYHMPASKFPGHQHRNLMFIACRIETYS
jgi:hypothetical protein